MPKAVPSTTLAVLRPTPGSSTSCLDVRGHLAVIPLQQGAAAVLDALRLVAEEAGALDVALQFGQLGPGVVGRRGILAEKVFVTRLTRSSVHWAERIVATSNSSGVWKSSEQVASG